MGSNPIDRPRNEFCETEANIDPDAFCSFAERKNHSKVGAITPVSLIDSRPQTVRAVSENGIQKIEASFANGNPNSQVMRDILIQVLLEKRSGMQIKDLRLELEEHEVFSFVEQRLHKTAAIRTLASDSAVFVVKGDSLSLNRHMMLEVKKETERRLDILLALSSVRQKPDKYPP